MCIEIQIKFKGKTKDLRNKLEKSLDTKILEGLPVGHLLYLWQKTIYDVYTRHVPTETLVMTSIDVSGRQRVQIQVATIFTVYLMISSNVS